MVSSDLANMYGNMNLGGRQERPSQNPRRRHPSAGRTPIRAPSTNRHPGPRPQLQPHAGDNTIRRAPSTKVRLPPPSSPRPQQAQMVRSQPATPQQIPRAPPNSYPAIFFDEGRGYLFVKVLGNGVDGSASLVRSVVNGKLYVRKEEFHWEHVPQDSAKYAITPPEEAANASIVRYVPGVYQAHGWTRWVNQRGEMAFNVTYWEYQNLGSLKGFVESAREMGRSVPESWGALWFVYMVQTTIRIQNAGIVHNDPHHGNWLLQTSTTGIPHITLGDFGRAERQSQLSSYKFKDRSTDDFHLILSTITSALGLVHDRQERTVWRPEGNKISPHLVKEFANFARISSTRWDSMAALHKAVMGGSGAILRMYDRSPNVTHPAAVPQNIDYAFMTGPELIPAVRVKPQGFKQWRHGVVVGNQIATRSTSLVERLVRHFGEWKENMGDGAPVWFVDRPAGSRYVW